jgi:hypothetical protein
VSQWVFQDRLFTILTPKNFIQGELGISILSYTFFVLNLTNSVLEKFETNKLALNHNFNLLKTSRTLFKKARGSGYT